MPWWFWPLAVLWSIPILTIAFVFGGAFWFEWRRARRLARRDEVGVNRLSRRYLADCEAEWTVEGMGETPMGWPDRYAGTRPRPHAGGTFRE